MPTINQTKYWESKKGKHPWNYHKKTGPNPKHSAMMKGRVSSMKGKKHTDASRLKMSLALKGKPTWNKGKKLSKDHRLKLRLAKLGKPGNRLGTRSSEESKEKNRIKHLGSKSNLWKGGTSKLTSLIRACYKYRQWRSDVFTRDNFTCQECGIQSGCGHTVIFQAHHMKSLAEIIKTNNITTLEQAIQCEELWNINNGQTLCKECHKLTDTYAVKNRKKLIIQLHNGKRNTKLTKSDQLTSRE